MSLECLGTTLIVVLLPGAGVIKALPAGLTRAAVVELAEEPCPTGPVAGRLMLRPGKRPLLR